VNVKRSFARIAALTVVAAIPIMGLSGIASAKVTAAKCAKHPGTAGCHSGTAGGSNAMTVTVSPNGTGNPLVEVGQSEVDAVIQVETQPGLAGTAVQISSQQLNSSCMAGPHPVVYDSIRTGTDVTSNGSITVYLDNEGNATVGLQAVDCAPGSDLVEADLQTVPFTTATTELWVNPPSVTTAGVYADPQGSNGQGVEVETGDTNNNLTGPGTCQPGPPGPPGPPPPPPPPCTSNASGDSDVYAVFFVEESPVYAEQWVQISSQQLESRCITGGEWLAETSPPPAIAPPAGVTSTPTRMFGPGMTPPNDVNTVLDDDGNAAFIFKGTSCAEGTSVVEADVLAGTHDTFQTTFTVLPPAVTI
jgi:hypothetical protein